MLLIFGEIMEIERKISVMKLYGRFKKEMLKKLWKRLKKNGDYIKNLITLDDDFKEIADKEGIEIINLK